MASQYLIRGSIVDSWVEGGGEGARVVLQVAPRGAGRSRGDLIFVEAAPALLADGGLLRDLGENLCHGNPVVAIGRPTPKGAIQATQIELSY